MDYENESCVSDCRKILREKMLFFNCTGAKQRAADCRSNRKCLLYKCEHYTSVGEIPFDRTAESMLVSTESSVIDLVVKKGKS